MEHGLAEQKAVAPTPDGICKTAGLVSDRQRTELLRIQLAEDARLETRLATTEGQVSTLSTPVVGGAYRRDVGRGEDSGLQVGEVRNTRFASVLCDFQRHRQP